MWPSMQQVNRKRRREAATQRLPTTAKCMRTRPIGRIADGSKDTWSTEIERRTTQKVMSQDLHKVSVREAFTASSAFWAAASNNRLYRSICPTAKRIPEQRIRPSEQRPAKAPLLLVRVATALYKVEFPTPHSTAYRPQAPACNLQGPRKSSSEEATRYPVLQSPWSSRPKPGAR